MSNLTLSVDEDLIKRARVRAIQQGTSLSAKVREFLQQYADESDDLLNRQRQAATTKLLDAMAVATRQSQPAAAPASASASAPASASPKQRSLREDLYQDDFRNRDRATQQPTGQ